MIAAVIATDDSVDDVSVVSNPAIVELIPPRGDTILPQSNVGVILELLGPLGQQKWEKRRTRKAVDFGRGKMCEETLGK